MLFYVRDLISFKLNYKSLYIATWVCICGQKGLYLKGKFVLSPLIPVAMVVLAALILLFITLRPFPLEINSTSYTFHEKERNYRQDGFE